MPEFHQLIPLAFQRGGQRSSALTPLLWLSGIVGVPSLYLCVKTQGWTRIALFSLAVLLVFADLVAYVYLVRKDPRLVQSESFQLESRRLDLVASKGGPELDATLVEITQEPKGLQARKSQLEAGGE